MRLLIVDDEPLLRQGIARIVERFGLPMEEIGQAENGREGLLVLERMKPDVVITDIKMPEMDGLDFIREAKNRGHRVQFVIVSGYEEFEYAKRGIRYGVVDYLLKPVEHDELRACLVRIMDKVEESRRQSTLYTELNRLRKLNDDQSRERLLTKWIEQEADIDGGAARHDDELASLLADSQEFAVIVFEIELPRLPYRSFQAGDETLLQYAVANALSYTELPQGRRSILFQHAVYEREWICVLGERQQIDVREIARDVAQWADGFQRYFKFDVTVGIGSPVKRAADLHQSYQQAKQALRDKILRGRNRVFLPAPAGGHVESSVLSDDDERMLFRLLNDCHSHAIISWLNGRLDEIVRRENATFHHLESFCVDLHLLYRKYLLIQTRAPEWVIGEIDDWLSWLHGVDRLEDIADKLADATGTLIEHIRTLRLAPDYDILEEIKRYIDAHLHEPLSLQSIAERFYIHPNYFSRRFKEKFKESFIQYVTNRRMRKAENLLLGSDLQIQEIAELVGFSDAAYFSSVFRKSTGKTPVQYRLQHMEPRNG